MKLLPFDYAVRNLGRAPTRLVLSVLGSTLVVLLVLAAAAFVRGMGKSMDVSAGADNVILLGAGSEESFERSEIAAGTDALVQQYVPDGIKTRLGVPYVSAKVHMATVVKESRDTARSPQVLVRGVNPAAFLVHPQARVAEGRLPEPGRDEILAGALASTTLGLPPGRLAVGRTLWFDDRDWTIVGRLEAPGTVMEAEIWCPLTDLQIAAKRQNLSCVILTLDPAAGGEFDDVDAFARQRLDLELVAMREGEYYAKLNEFFRPIAAMVWATAGLVGLGGLLGGLNTMYAAFASRVRELGALQALGFPRYAIVVSLVQESLLASAAGAVIGAAVALAAFDGMTVRFSAGVFGLVVDSAVLAAGLGAGLLMGIVGALPPAWRCLRLPINEGLKAG